MSIEQKSKIWAVASVFNNAGGSVFTPGPGGVGVCQRGFLTTVRTGAGVYTLTLDPLNTGIDVTESVVIVTPRVATEATATYTKTNDFTIVVRTWAFGGGAADNTPFDIMVVGRGA